MATLLYKTVVSREEKKAEWCSSWPVKESEETSSTTTYVCLQRDCTSRIRQIVCRARTSVDAGLSSGGMSGDGKEGRAQAEMQMIDIDVTDPSPSPSRLISSQTHGRYKRGTRNLSVPCNDDEYDYDYDYDHDQGDDDSQSTHECDRDSSVQSVHDRRMIPSLCVADVPQIHAIIYHLWIMIVTMPARYSGRAASV
ncbi:hypothetical protein EJ05DRAFT_534370 [Pseudovirgaria hyperparasitica]|uniref:Uncharacterized protein n=1 Tax=Pseudovirgaria hyperparasitica TaxID=470096 RepID=A0A6A6WL29_9PEZI|nr:uncharacterized protein EJ05DRAFT_534370 [Pseudovirgaria hyperparasitica]KAF2762910.1 hypothetical protein EJ05DRAFT_534370 [Pseudovirgaria hyperparasitica]